MKIIFSCMILFVLGSYVHAQQPVDTSKHVNPTLIIQSSAITAVQAVTANAVTNTGTNTAVLPNSQSVVDPGALDSARNHPREYLYSKYLFEKKTVEKPADIIIKWFFVILGTFILFVMWKWVIQYSLRDGLCKDLSFDTNGNLKPVQQSSYSYSRVQLLWWSMIILTCYVFFFGVTGVLLPLNVTSALLLGFGAVVCGIGKVIDNRQILENRGNRSQDESEKRPEFIKDILSDENGVSVHRFQAVIFNLVFGAGFLGFFIKNMIAYKYPLPDFTEWQFSLLGISSATYLGLKSSENKPATGAAANAAAQPRVAAGEDAGSKAYNKF